MKTITHNITKLLAITASLMLLAACGRPADLCVYGDDFGDLTHARVVVEAANNGWLDTGVDVVGGAAMQITSRGEVEICKAERHIDQKINFNLLSDQWQDSGIIIYNNEKYSLTWDANGLVKLHSGYIAQGNGHRIHGYFATTTMADTTCGNKTGDFSLVGGISETTSTTAQKKLYLWLEDSCGDYSDNTNAYDSSTNYEYTLKVDYSKSCPGRDGQFLVGFVGDPASGSGQEFSMHNCPQTGCGSTIPGAYNALAPASGRLWLRIKDNAGIDWSGNGSPDNLGDGDYTLVSYDQDVNPPSYTAGSNEGRYVVDIVAVKQITGGFSDVVNLMIDPVKDLLLGTVQADGSRKDGLIEQMYNGITVNGGFVNAVRAAMALSIAIFGLSYMLGLSNITQRELFVLIFRLGIIITLISPGSWDFFYNFLFIFFLEGTEELIWLMSSQFTTAISGVQDTSQVIDGVSKEPQTIDIGAGSRDTFGFLNQTFARFFSTESNTKIWGLAGSFPLGPAYALLIYISILYFVLVVAKAIILYLIAIIMVGLLLFIAPIIMPFMLFSKTRSIFDNWLKQLINFSLQPVLLFMVLAIFNVFIYSAFYALLTFTVCWGCVIEIDLLLSEALGIAPNSWDRICIMPGYRAWGMDDAQSLAVSLNKFPVAIFNILILFSLVHALSKFTDWVVKVATSLSGLGSGGINLSSPVSSGIKEATKAVDSAAGGARNVLGIGKDVNQSVADGAKGLTQKRDANKPAAGVDKKSEGQSSDNASGEGKSEENKQTE